MSNLKALHCLFCLLLISTSSFATTVIVSNTSELATAINNASDGDIIVVQSGYYQQDTPLQIENAITIIGESLLDQPELNLDLEIDAEATIDGDVTLQNIEFISGNLNFASASVGTLSLIDLTLTSTPLTIDATEQISSVNIVGTMTSDNIFLQNIEQLVIAYSNIMTASNFTVYDVNSLFVIGNSISGGTGDTTKNLARFGTTWGNGGTRIGSATIYGNHFEVIQHKSDDPSTGINDQHEALMFKATSSLISNNLFTISASDVSDYGTDPDASVGIYIRAITILGSGEHRISNNVFDVSADRDHIEGHTIIRLSGVEVEIVNNIFVGGANRSLATWSSSTDIELSEFENNICFDVGEKSCFSSTSNIKTDPLFVDSANYNYALGDSSPAIDAGVEGTAYFDVDGSRVDIGYNGGATPFDQYSRTILDVRNRRISSEPYIVPLIRASQGIAGDNTLRVKLLTVARAR